MSNTYDIAHRIRPTYHFKDQAAFDGYPFVVRFTWCMIRHHPRIDKGRFLELLENREELVRYCTGFHASTRKMELSTLQAIAESNKRELNSDDQLRSIYRYCFREDATINVLCILLENYLELYPPSD